MSRYGQSEKVVGDTAHRSACLNMLGVHCEDASSSSLPLNEGGSSRRKHLISVLSRRHSCVSFYAVKNYPKIRSLLMTSPATPCKPTEAQQILSVLRRSIRAKHGADAAKIVRIVYTGSVNPQNASGFAKLPDCDGFVLGRAGSDVKQLAQILQTLASTKPATKRSSTKKQPQVDVPDGDVIPGKSRESIKLRAGVIETHTAMLERKSKQQSFDIGMATADSGEHVITHVHDGGPAEDKLAEGDILSVVNGVDVAGLNHDEVVQLLNKDVVAHLVTERRIGTKELTRRSIGDGEAMGLPAAETEASSGAALKGISE